MEMNQQKIDFLINDEVLNTMASDFQYNEQTIRLDYGYKYRRKNYVKIDEMQATSTNILSCNGIILKKMELSFLLVKQ